MRALIQRVSKASVCIDNQITASINTGLLVLIGIESSDTEEDILYITKKVTQLRIFDDDNNLMNKSVSDIQGEILLVSQFTLHASTHKGNRPSYIQAAKPEVAKPIYNALYEAFKSTHKQKVATGTFGANMQITLTNNGPVTIWIDSKNRTL